MKPSSLLAFLAALIPCAASAWTPRPLDRPAYSYITSGLACYGTNFTEIDSLNDFPPDLLTLIKQEVDKVSFKAWFGGESISDRGGRFQPGCAYVDDTPHFRFVTGALSKDVALIAVENGGIGYNVQMWSFLKTAKGWEAAQGGNLPIQLTRGQSVDPNKSAGTATSSANTSMNLDTTPDSPKLKARRDFNFFLPQARHILGCSESAQHSKVSNDAALARSLKKKAQDGDATAQFALAHLYANGRGVAKNFTDAQTWFSRAAVDHADMQYDLGYFYATGVDVAQDYGAAMHWFRLSSGASDNALKWLSYFQLGMLFDDGKGVPVNRIAAYALYLAARDYAYAPLSSRKEALEASMSKDDLALAEALRHELHAEAQDNGTITDTLDAFLARGKAEAALKPSS